MGTKVGQHQGARQKDVEQETGDSSPSARATDNHQELSPPLPTAQRSGAWAVDKAMPTDRTGTQVRAFHQMSFRWTQ